MAEIIGYLDPGIAHLVYLLRGHNHDTFSSCEGGAGHAFTSPTIRINPMNPDDMREQCADISSILSDYGFSGYYIKHVYAYQEAATRWDVPNQNFIEIEFWAECLP